MAGINESRIFRVPGKLIKSPTSTDPADRATNFGGTLLGSGDEFHVMLGFKYGLNHAQELTSTQNVMLINDDPRVAFNLREWDNDSLDDVMPSSASGVVTVPGAAPSGTVLSRKTYLYAADRDDVPSVYLYSAVPLVSENAMGLRFSQLYELNLPILFLCLRGSTDAIKIGPLGSL